jgi:outer membrane phospholipase A
MPARPVASSVVRRPVPVVPLLRALCAAAAFASAAAPADAAVALLQPAREAVANAPLTLTLLYTADEDAPLEVAPPPTLDVTLAADDRPPAPLSLTRDPDVPARFTLRPGAYRKVRYTAAWPANLNGGVTLTPLGVDASPALVVLNRGPRQTALAQAEQAAAQATTPAARAAASARLATLDAAPLPTSDALTTAAPSWLSSHLSYYEPMYFGVGTNGGTSARFQFSFKYRLRMPDDPASRRFLDNLYFSYTQTSIWDLSSASKPFRDTSYKPRLFYYLADTGWRSAWFTRMGVAAGIGHESNGKAGSTSRSLNIAFVQPTWEFGRLDDYHLQVSPMIYYYLDKSENDDIANYRGYADLLVKYGSPDGWQLATTLRKGTRHGYGSIDAQFSYPLAKLVGPAWGGYVWIGYFNGYGEDLLDYNRRQHWIARIGFSIAR